MAAGGHRRDFDPADRRVLPGGRRIPTGHAVRDFSAEWGWHALNGLITWCSAFLILAQWPVSGLWVIGLFLGSSWCSTVLLGSRSALRLRAV
jgi:uncharacterized membrane protein HdeD (DUF308 family)